MPRIAFGGTLGAGKTEVCKRLHETLGYYYFYAGGVFKRMAEERGMPIEEFYASIASDPTIDRAVDLEQERLIREKEDIILEGRVSAFLAPEVPRIKVFLKASPEEGARRQQNRPDNKNRTIAEILARTEMRMAVERERYAALYPSIGDYMDERRFDIVIDTTHLSRDAAFRAVMDALAAAITQTAPI